MPMPADELLGLFVSQVAECNKARDAWISSPSLAAHQHHADLHNNVRQALMQLTYLNFLVGEVLGADGRPRTDTP